MTKNPLQNFPLFQLSYQEVKGKTIVGEIRIEAPCEMESVKVKQLSYGAIQLVCNPQKSYHFKNSEERIILTLTPQILLELQAALQNDLAGEDEAHA